ncbi:hypothetical protein LOAG_00987 [Loa loa]|uniref:Uncharacterized protein n=1 Tax=Loa loa TaxID=7209 RepID=A0A1S0UAG7_LOALO|nr:hypothetical protein LOAG_00987 [Loa loa]EFO27495.2 hypothetical protein LOAG_00987 [Loa loa]
MSREMSTNATSKAKLDDKIKGIDLTPSAKKRISQQYEVQEKNYRRKKLNFGTLEPINEKWLENIQEFVTLQKRKNAKSVEERMRG